MSRIERFRFERGDARYSQDGSTVLVRLRLDRASFEYAREWAVDRSRIGQMCTAEDELEHIVSAALFYGMEQLNWTPPRDDEDDPNWL